MTRHQVFTRHVILDANIASAHYSQCSPSTCYRLFFGNRIVREREENPMLSHKSKVRQTSLTLFQITHQEDPWCQYVTYIFIISLSSRRKLGEIEQAQQGGGSCLSKTLAITQRTYTRSKHYIPSEAQSLPIWSLPLETQRRLQRPGTGQIHQAHATDYLSYEALMALPSAPQSNRTSS